MTSSMGFPVRDCSSCNSVIWSSVMTALSRRKESSISGFMILFLVAHGRGDDLIRRGHARHDLADAIFAQGAHAEVARALADGGNAEAFVDHSADFIVEHANFKDTHPALVTGAATFV